MNEEQSFSVIQCNHLAKEYKDGHLRVPVFDDINLSVASGEMIAVIGASGAGKTTLLQLMGGLDKPTSGEVLVTGENISAISESARCELRNRALGFIYQFHHLLPEFSALENVCMPLLIRGVKKKMIIETAMDLIEKVGLMHRYKHRVGEMSGGERQRIAIARALVNHPACVLADEPTGNLDQQTAEIVFQLMLDLNKSLGISFVIVTHNVALANRLDRMLCLKSGRLVSENK